MVNLDLKMGIFEEKVYQIEGKNLPKHCENG